MLEKIPILFTLCCVAAQTPETKKPVLLKLTPEQIRDTFDTVMSDDYIKVMAKDFASKAVQYFMKEMNYQKAVLADKFTGQIYKLAAKRPERTIGTEKLEPLAPEEIQNKASVQPTELLKSQEAFALLKEPSPDGDNLYSHSEELSGESTRDKIPVIEVMKINGAYFRRLLGLI